MRAVAFIVAGLGRARPGGTQELEEVKRFRGRELRETAYKGTPIRYFLEIFTVSLPKLSAVPLQASKPEQTQRFAEYMGEVGSLATLGSYLRCDVHQFQEGDKEKWIYRNVGGTWIWHRVFHPSRKDRARPEPGETLLEKTPNGEVIIGGPLPQLAGIEDYVKWMAVSVARAKEAEVPLGQHLPFVKHITVTE